jgi:hypothetical protein
MACVRPYIVELIEGNNSSMGNRKFICDNRIRFEYFILNACAINFSIYSHRTTSCISNWKYVGEIHAKSDIYNFRHRMDSESGSIDNQGTYSYNNHGQCLFPRSLVLPEFISSDYLVQRTLL